HAEYMDEIMIPKKRLEDFPELMHCIQSLLPIEEAARTSILSKSWLYAWSTNPTLRLKYFDGSIEISNRIKLRLRIENVQKLIEMGFPEALVKSTLEAAGGDIEVALDRLHLDLHIVVAVLFIAEKKLLMASPDQQWYMDIGATSHLSSHTGNLQTSSLNRNFHSVIVGNESFIPVTHSGHLQIPNPYRPLHLKNVLVIPNIIKNLVSVRKFTTDNKCSIDFDPYGFTVRDYHTRQTLLRCDSTGDLYPLHVAASAFAPLTNNHSLWHQRLGHPDDNVIQTLSSRGLVSYNKQNTQNLCRACQLRKQTKLPF
ncbi:ribonuclease H-like domain-containing protein, partial [Tanacetum coccineum]